jgi:hypothetical protein
MHSLSWRNTNARQLVSSRWVRYRSQLIHLCKGDPQTAVSHLGDVVLFLQSTLSRYHASRTNHLDVAILTPDNT